MHAVYMIQMLDTALNMLVRLSSCVELSDTAVTWFAVPVHSHFFSVCHFHPNRQGPDIELLTEIMEELGVKHIRYGVRPDMFPMMGDALLETLSGTLGDAFNDSVREAWKETYAELSQDMIKAQAGK